MSPAPSRSTAAIFIIGLILLMVLAAGLYMIKGVLLASPAVLSDTAFHSVLEQRSYWDESLQQTVNYWVLKTTNQSSAPYYSCHFTVISKGTQDTYEGFFKNYTLRDCRAYTLLKTNYDCRLENAWKKYTQYAGARQLRKFLPSSSSELAVSRFYLDDQTRSDQSFLTRNSLSDIYSYQITCRTSAGKPVTHTQVF